MTQSSRDRSLTRVDGVSYGSNKLDPMLVFRERKKYREQIFPPGLIPNFRNLWGEDSYYGIVNTAGNTVVLDDSYLKQLYYGQKSTLFALNFVADAWRDFAEKMRELASSNILHKDSPWATPVAYKAWEGADSLYNSYLLETVYPVFSQTYLGSPGEDKKVVDFQSYMGVFSEYVERVHDKGFPLTRSGFLESSLCPLSVSGLIIEIGEEEYDDDFSKTAIFKDENFELASQIAYQYGFSIDRNVPWRLVADLDNPCMREYMYGLPIEQIRVDNKNDVQCDDPILRNPALVPEAYAYSQVTGLEFVRRRMNTYISNSQTNILSAGYKVFRQLKNVTEIPQVYKKLFSSYYTETWNSDMGLLRLYLYAMYKAYVSDNPTILHYEKDPACAKGTSTIIERTVPPSEIMTTVNNEYGHLWDLKSFYGLRGVERRKKRSFLQEKKETQRIFSNYRLLNVADEASYASALKYCQVNFVGPIPHQGLTYLTVGDIIK